MPTAYSITRPVDQPLPDDVVNVDPGYWRIEAIIGQQRGIGQQIAERIDSLAIPAARGVPVPREHGQGDLHVLREDRQLDIAVDLLRIEEVEASLQCGADRLCPVCGIINVQPCWSSFLKSSRCPIQGRRLGLSPGDALAHLTVDQGLEQWPPSSRLGKRLHHRGRGIRQAAREQD